MAVASTGGSIVATLALAAVTATAIAGMGRLFRGDGFLAPLIAVAATAHLTCWLGRRLGSPMWLASGASLVMSVLVALWLIVPETTAWGLPTLGSVHRVASELSTARADFSLLHAPVPSTSGFLLLASFCVGAIVTAADWAAFRLGLGVEAVLPSFALVFFTDALGTSGGRVVATAAYALAVVGFALAKEADRRTATTPWIGGAAEAGRVGWLGRGALLGATAVLAGAVIGPALPGAQAAPLVRWHNGGTIGAGERTAISPLVDVRTTEVNEASTELFTVDASRPSYWRLTALDHFDGNVWSADQRYRPVRRYATTGGPAGSTILRQKVTISSLSEPWLPAAYQPTEVDLPGGAIDTASSSIIASSDTRAGMTYVVQSAVPDLTPSDLEQVTDGALKAGLGGDYAAMVELPADFPSRISGLAATIISKSGATTPYERAIALQSFFRSGQFTYSLSVPAGHDTDALTSFLFDTRTGFCEQFASAYAVMARSVGLPTRVAVGFTYGTLRHGLYHVYGTHAHAWPEVYLGPRFGWVAFEPTVTRGPPDAPWTGVDVAQARDPTGPGASATAGAGTSPVRSAPNPSGLRGPDLRGLLATGGGAAASGAPGGANRLLIAALVVAGLGVIWLGGVPLLRLLRRERRRRRAGDGAERVLVAWSEASEELGARGVVRRDGETLAEYASRATLCPLGVEGASGMAELARTTEAVAYSARQVGTREVELATAAADRVTSDLASGRPPLRRFLAAVDARPLLPPEWRRRSEEPTARAGRPLARRERLSPRA